MLLAYEETTNGVFLRTVDITGWTISLGTAVGLGGGTTLAEDDTLTYDPVNNTAVVFYDGQYCRLATVGSGTVTFTGTGVNVDSGGTYTIMRSIYVPSIGKTVFVYVDSSWTTISVNTVDSSGTSPVFGTKVSIAEGSTSAMSYDLIYSPLDDRILLTYRRPSDSEGVYREVFIGCDGITVTLGDPVSFFDPPTGNTNVVSTVWDTTNEKIDVFIVEGVTNDLYGTNLLPGTDTNLEADNLLGVSLSCYTDGTTGRFGVFGYLDDGQTGLTPNTDYFINGYGQLTTDWNDVFVGHAYSDTDLVIKGTGNEANEIKSVVSDGTAGLSGTQVLDLGTHNYHNIVIDGDIIIDSSNLVVGNKGTIVLQQDGTGGHTFTFDTEYVFPNGAPSIDPTANAWHLFEYTVMSGSVIHVLFVSSWV
jgi:hypothetical protein